MTEKTPLTEIRTSEIYKVHPKLITIGVRSGRDKELITINLPITNNVYTNMMENIGIGNIAKHFPLIFFIDAKGTATKVLPLEDWNKRKQEQEVIKDDSTKTSKPEDTA